MKKFRMFRVFFLLFAVLFALSGCTGKTTVEQSGNAYTIYYLNTSGIQLVGSEYRTETTDLDALVRELLDKMGNVPADLDCQRALPERIEKITYRIEGNVLYLYADANYAGGADENTDPDSGYRVSEHLLRGAADHGRCGKPGGNAFRL